MRKLVHNRDRGNIQRISRVSFERANAALTSNDVVIPASHNVFSGEQQFFKRRRNPALQQDWSFQFSQFAQQIEILHIPRAHLQNVHVRQHHFDLRNFHHLADHQQVELVSGFAQKFKRFESQSLKRIRRATRLECSSPQRPRSSLRHQFCNREELFPRLHRARPRHDQNFFAAHLHAVRKLNHRSLRTKAAPRQLVRRANAMHFHHPAQHFQVARVEIGARAHGGKNGLPLASGAVNRESHFDQVLNHHLNLVFGCGVLHRDNHK